MGSNRVTLLDRRPAGWILESTACWKTAFRETFERTPLPKLSKVTDPFLKPLGNNLTTRR